MKVNGEHSEYKLILIRLNIVNAKKKGMKKKKKKHIRELAMEMSWLSLGSSHTLPFPHFITEAASRFWIFRDTIFASFSLPCGDLFWCGEELKTSRKMCLYMTFSRVTYYPSAKKNNNHGPF